MSRKNSKISFEHSMQRLESIVSQIEQGGLSLDNTLKLFAEGVTLVNQCRQTLDSAEQKVRVLNDTGQLVDFPSPMNHQTETAQTDY